MTCFFCKGEIDSDHLCQEAASALRGAGKRASPRDVADVVKATRAMQAARKSRLDSLRE